MPALVAVGCVEDDDSPLIPSINYGSFTDSRDGKSYRTVVIGSQVWMAENLNYQTSDSWCYDNDPSNCARYGRLYTWSATERDAGYARRRGMRDNSDRVYDTWDYKGTVFSVRCLRDD